MEEKRTYEDRPERDVQIPRREREETETPRPERKPKLISKKVSGCSKLNVRSDPDASDPSNIIKTIDKDDIVKIDQKFSDPKFERVVFEDGEVGYVMKDYLTAL